MGSARQEEPGPDTLVRTHVEATLDATVAAVRASIAAVRAHSDLIESSAPLRNKLQELQAASGDLVHLLTQDTVSSLVAPDLVFEDVVVPEDRLAELRAVVVEHAQKPPPQTPAVEANDDDDDDDDLVIEEVSLSQEELDRLRSGATAAGPPAEPAPSPSPAPENYDDDDDDDDLIVEEIQLSPEELAKLGVTARPA